METAMKKTSVNSSKPVVSKQNVQQYLRLIAQHGGLVVAAKGTKLGRRMKDDPPAYPIKFGGKIHWFRQIPVRNLVGQSGAAHPQWEAQVAMVGRPANAKFVLAALGKKFL
jgi:hypothetical protein